MEKEYVEEKFFFGMNIIFIKELFLVFFWKKGKIMWIKKKY